MAIEKISTRASSEDAHSWGSRMSAAGHPDAERAANGLAWLNGAREMQPSLLSAIWHIIGYGEIKTASDCAFENGDSECNRALVNILRKIYPEILDGWDRGSTTAHEDALSDLKRISDPTEQLQLATDTLSEFEAAEIRIRLDMPDAIKPKLDGLIRHWKDQVAILNSQD